MSVDIPSDQPVTPGTPESPVNPQVETPESPPRRIQMEFRGSGSEFFRIWIVNVLLSIVTLGIYSAWAKVRTKRYFYGNTYLDNHNFEYTADPIVILKGRIIAAVLLVGYIFAQNFFPVISGLLALAGMIIFPWFFVRAYAFNAYHSVYRGIRFRFSRSYGEAAKAYILWPFLGVITFGILYPSAILRQEKLLVEGHSYGESQFSLNIRVGQIWAIVGIMIALGVLFAIGTSVLTAIIAGVSGLEGAENRNGIFAIISMIPLFLFYFVMMAYFTVAMMNLRYGNMLIAGNQFNANYKFGAWLWLLVSNTFMIVLTLGLAIPWAMVRVVRYRASCTSLNARDMDHFVAGESNKTSALGDEVGEAFDLGFGI
ncbi:YjgN family protein [Porticoccaceae bacterium LTM1]|nr:YjgN family protein [Porticoccaceae bacterium LTM1]